MTRRKKGALLTDIDGHTPKFKNPYKTPTAKGQRNTIKKFYKD